MQHDADPVRDVPDHAQVVGDEKEGEVAVLAQVEQQVEDLRLDGDVEGGGGFVQHQQRGPDGEGAGDGDALALAAGELVGVAGEDGRGQADALEFRGGVGHG